MSEQGFGGYVSRLRKQDKTPLDPYSHAYTLLSATDTKKSKEMHKIVDRDMLLGNIDNDELLRLYQAEMHSIANLASMADGDEELEPFYVLKHSALKAELSITRAHKGMERRMQDGFARHPGESAGFGSTLEGVGFGGGRQEGDGIKEKFGGFMSRMPRANEDMFLK